MIYTATRAPKGFSSWHERSESIGQIITKYIKKVSSIGTRLGVSKVLYFGTNKRSGVPLPVPLWHENSEVTFFSTSAAKWSLLAGGQQSVLLSTIPANVKS